MKKYLLASLNFIIIYTILALLTKWFDMSTKELVLYFIAYYAATRQNDM